MAKVIYDADVDIAFVLYQEGPDVHAVDFGNGRTVEMSDAGEIMGIEFVDAQQGVDLSGLPVDVKALIGEFEKLQLPIRGTLPPELVPMTQGDLTTAPAALSGAIVPLAQQTKMQTANFSPPQLLT